MGSSHPRRLLETDGTMALSDQVYHPPTPPPPGRGTELGGYQRAGAADPPSSGQFQARYDVQRGKLLWTSAVILAGIAPILQDRFRKRGSLLMNPKADYP